MHVVTFCVRIPLDKQGNVHKYDSHSPIKMLTTVKRVKFSKNKKNTSQKKMPFLTLIQYPVDLLTFLELYLKSS